VLLPLLFSVSSVLCSVSFAMDTDLVLVIAPITYPVVIPTMAMDTEPAIDLSTADASADALIHSFVDDNDAYDATVATETFPGRSRKRKYRVIESEDEEDEEEQEQEGKSQAVELTQTLARKRMRIESEAKIKYIKETMVLAEEIETMMATVRDKIIQLENVATVEEARVVTMMTQNMVGVTMILVSEGLTVAYLRQAAKDAELKMCKTPGCGEHPRSEFCVNKTTSSGLNYKCRSCCSALSRAHAFTFRGFFRTMASNCRTNASNRSGAASICELTRYDLGALWEKQQGRCALTGVPMSHAPNSDFKASPERLDNALGYVHGNVVLIIAELNTPAQWTRGKLDKWLENIDPTPEQHAIQSAYMHALFNPPPHPPPQARVASVRKTIDDVPSVTCGGCNITMPLSAFGSKNRCRDCVYRYNEKSALTLHGAMLMIAGYARRHTNTRKEGKGGEPCTIDADFLVALFIKQRGRCHWSNVPMAFGFNVPWKCSLERLDVKKGYTPKNVALVCFEANPMDQTNRGEYTPSEGSAGWNRKKIDLVVQHLKQKRADEALAQSQASK
jgi:hypothetical protein